MAHFTRTWNASYEATPADTDNASEGANRIRDLKSDIQERLVIDHSWAGDDSDGEHTQVTLIEAAGDPANVANRGFLYTKDVSGVTELYYEDSAGNVTQVTSGGTPGATGTAGQTLVTSQDATVRSWVTRHNYISSLVPSIDGTDAVNDISVTAGQCADTTGAAIMSGGAMIKRIDAAWAAGTNQGGFPSALTLTDDTWYHFFAIFDVTNGLTDYGFDTSLTATNLLADATDYSLYRWLGPVLRGTATNIDYSIYETEGSGIDVLWKDPPRDISVSNPGTGAVLRTLSVPPIANTIAHLNIQLLRTTAAPLLYMSSTSVNDEAPSSSAAPLNQLDVIGASQGSGQFLVRSDSSSQVRSRVNVSDGGTILRIVTTGFTCHRR